MIALEDGKVLKTVIFPDLNLTSLMAICDHMYSLKLRTNLNISPHFIDIENHVFRFRPSLNVQITSYEVSSLKSLLNRFKITQLTLKGVSFSEEEITSLWDLIRDNQFLISVDVSDCCLSDDDLFVDLLTNFLSVTLLKTISQKYLKHFK
ncbi:hypothetical protein GEMRC1_001322 [Eukaryota sp. GEM-RC1]